MGIAARFVLLLALATSAARESQAATVVAASVTCRRTPSSSSGIVTRLDRGTTVRILARRGPWCRLAIGPRRAWAPCAALSRARTREPEPEPAIPPGSEAVAGWDLEARRVTRLSGERVFSIERGEPLVVLRYDETGRWARVFRRGEGAGWIPATALAESVPEGAEERAVESDVETAPEEVSDPEPRVDLATASPRPSRAGMRVAGVVALVFKAQPSPSDPKSSLSLELGGNAARTLGDLEIGGEGLYTRNGRNEPGVGRLVQRLDLRGVVALRVGGPVALAGRLGVAMMSTALLRPNGTDVETAVGPLAGLGVLVRPEGPIKASVWASVLVRDQVKDGAPSRSATVDVKATLSLGIGAGLMAVASYQLLIDPASRSHLLGLGAAFGF